MWLYKNTPLHRANFLKLSAEGYFNGTTFHRVIPNFVIQGGDPNSKDADSTNDGSGGPAYTIPAEFNDSLTHVFGAVGAARDGNPAKASNGSQFYIVVAPAGQHGLDKNYTVFGLVFSGMATATKIVNSPRNASDRPYTPQVIESTVIEMTLAELKSRFGFVPVH
jgi:cyclophilin family peptidyl-prolyl cis-trans isomerase